MFALSQYQTNYFSLKMKKPIYCKLLKLFCEHQRLVPKYNPITKCAKAFMKISFHSILIIVKLTFLQKAKNFCY